MKIIFRLITVIVIFLILSVSYLSLVGIETEKFNSQISKKINSYNKDFKIELKKIKLVLNPLKLKVNVKTVGARIINQNKSIKIENIRSEVSIRALFKEKFSIQNLDISTNSIRINELISFLRLVNDTPELFILEKIIKKGYLIADIKLEFDDEGKIKNNYLINGFVKDVKFDLLNKYKFNKINFIFSYSNNYLELRDTQFNLNDINFISKEILIKDKKKKFFIEGNIEHKEINFDKRKFDLFLKPFLFKRNISEIRFSSKNTFSFNIDKKFKLKDLRINSKILIGKLLIDNNPSLNRIFPEIKKKANISNSKININYERNNLLIEGNGDIFLQNKKDQISFFIKKKNKNYDFKTSLKMKDNPILIKFLNYKKKQNDNAQIDITGSIDKNNEIFIKSLSLLEKKNKIEITNLKLNRKLNVIDLDKINLDYLDKEDKKNSIKFFKKNKQSFLEGNSFNANNLINNLLKSEDSSIFDINRKININIKNVFLDNDYSLKDFTGNLYFKNKEIFKAKLVGNFSENKKLKFTINTDQGNKITTLFVDNAETIIKRYDFIKGFNEGSLDFYNTKNSEKSVSTLKVYDFKLKEVPVLTKILTLASLQGIADILSGEGIRFNEFEMNFQNKDNLVTINEIYAIGPAISILMDGYVEKNKLISLRGTLVPATTINKFIGSLPVLGKILVGKKTGEGVFGVSFKIKGPPKNLETTVNPIKTLTPRFITRTLERIKKTN